MRPSVTYPRRHRLAQHIDDGLYEVPADDGVLLRRDVQRGVLVRYALHDRQEWSEVVDVHGVRVDRLREYQGLVVRLS